MLGHVLQVAALDPRGLIPVSGRPGHRNSVADGHTILCAFENIGEVSKALEASLGEAESVKTIWRPQTSVPVDEERAQSLMRLVATLEDDDDVQSVYANFEVDDATMAKLSAA